MKNNSFAYLRKTAPERLLRLIAIGHSKKEDG